MRIDIPNVQGSGEKWLDIMRAICGDTSKQSLIDCMCHHAPYTPQLGFKKRTYVDTLNRGLDFKKEQRYFFKRDILDFLADVPPKFYSTAICSDGVEHFRLPEAMKLLAYMEKASFRQILFTPLGSHNIEKVETNDPDSHKSGWTPGMLEKIFPGHFAYIVMPNFHNTVGAFFFFHTPNLEQEFERIYNELKQIEWTKLS